MCECNILGVRLKILKTKWTDLKNQQKQRIHRCIYPSKWRPEHGLLPKFLLPKLLRPILPTPIDDTRLVAGDARLVTDACVMTDDSSTLTSHRRSVYSTLLFFMKRSWNFKIKPDEYNPIHSNTQTIPTTNVFDASNKNPQPIRLGYSSFENTGSLVENLVTPVNLSLGYNLKPDMYDSRPLCLTARLFYLIVGTVQFNCYCMYAWSSSLNLLKNCLTVMYLKKK